MNEAEAPSNTTPLVAPAHLASIHPGRGPVLADNFERWIWAVLLVGVIAVLGMAAWLTPNYPAGVGTHEQLGLPPCGLIALYDIPCPSCGFTTCFSLGMHFRWIDATINQPFGFLLFLASIVSVPLAVRVIVYRYSVLAATQRWPWIRIFIGVFALWLAAWGYKVLIWPPAA